MKRKATRKRSAVVPKGAFDALWKAIDGLTVDHHMLQNELRVAQLDIATLRLRVDVTQAECVDTPRQMKACVLCGAAYVSGDGRHTCQPKLPGL